MLSQNPDAFKVGQVRDVFIPFSDGYVDDRGNHGKTRPSVVVGWSSEIEGFGRSIMVVPITSFGSGGMPTPCDVRVDHTYQGNQCYAQPHRLLTVQRNLLHLPRQGVVITSDQLDAIMDGVMTFFPEDPSIGVMIRHSSDRYTRFVEF